MQLHKYIIIAQIGKGMTYVVGSRDDWRKADELRETTWRKLRLERNNKGRGPKPRVFIYSFYSGAPDESLLS